MASLTWCNIRGNLLYKHSSHQDHNQDDWLNTTYSNAMHVLYAWRLMRTGLQRVGFGRLDAIGDLTHKVKVDSFRRNPRVERLLEVVQLYALMGFRDYSTKEILGMILDQCSPSINTRLSQL